MCLYKDDDKRGEMGVYVEEDVIKIKEDLEEKIGACMVIGLGNLAHSLNEALNLIDYLWEEQERKK